MDLNQEIDLCYIEFEAWVSRNPTGTAEGFLDQGSYSDHVKQGLRELIRIDQQLAHVACPSDEFISFNRAKQEQEEGEVLGTSLTGKVIGNYRFVRRLGVGGMGAVWLADQREPIQRKVAIKLIRPELASDVIVRRFKAEQQALAMMTHPDIAKVLDAGTISGDQPYFVMEYFPGIPVTEYCDNHRLGIKDRLELFLQICNAIQHAHQTGLLHRDVKPSNILVSKLDGKPRVKIIDFGLAKLVEDSVQTEPALTQSLTAIGSPLWMSPEQATGCRDGDSLDARTDIYSLGVVLYELLTGSTPIEPAEFKRVSQERINVIIRESVPDYPSIRLVRGGDESGRDWIDQKTSSSFNSWSSELKNDLDWVAMKAIAKERDRRYSSVTEFSNDIRKFLNGEPVVARPPSASYRMKKLIGKHRSQSLTAIAIVFAIIASTISIMWAYQQGANATGQKLRADKALEILFNEIDELDLSNPEVKFDKSQRTYLLAKLDRIDETDFSQDPLLEADFRSAIANALSGLGMYEVSSSQLERAYEIRNAELGNDNLLTNQSQLALAFESIRAYRTKFAVEISDKCYNTFYGKHGKSHELTIGARTALIVARIQYGELHSQTKILESFLPEAENALSESHEYVIKASTALAEAHFRRHQFQEAADLSERSLAQALKQWGPDDERAIELESINWLALASTQSLNKTMPELNQHYEQVKNKLGAPHPITLKTQRACAFVLVKQKRSETKPKERFELAIELMQQHVDDCIVHLGSDALLTGEAWKALAMLQAPAGHFDQSIDSFHAAIEIFKLKQLPNSVDMLDCYRLIGNVLARDNCIAEAHAIAAKFLPIANREIGPESKIAFDLKDLLACCRFDLGHTKEAILDFEEMCKIAKRRSGENSVDVAKLKARLASAYFRMGDFEKSIACHKFVAATFSDKQKGNAQFALRAKAHLYNTMLRASRFDEVEQAIHEQLSGTNDVQENSTLTNYQLQFQSNLSDALAELGKFDDAKVTAASVLKQENLLERLPMVFADAKRAQAICCMADGDLDGAQKLFTESQNAYELANLGAEYKWRLDRLSEQLVILESMQESQAVVNASTDECVLFEQR